MVLAICSALKVPALCGPFLLLVPLSSLTLAKAPGSLSPPLLIGDEQCFLGAVHLDVCSVHAALTAMLAVALHAMAASPRGSQPPWPLPEQAGHEPDAL